MMGMCPSCKHSLLNHRPGGCIAFREDARLSGLPCGCRAHLPQLCLPFPLNPFTNGPASIEDGEHLTLASSTLAKQHDALILERLYTKIGLYPTKK